MQSLSEVQRLDTRLACLLRSHAIIYGLYNHIWTNALPAITGRPIPKGVMRDVFPYILNAIARKPSTSLADHLRNLRLTPKPETQTSFAFCIGGTEMEADNRGRTADWCAPFPEVATFTWNQSNEHAAQATSEGCDVLAEILHSLGFQRSFTDLIRQLSKVRESADGARSGFSAPLLMSDSKNFANQPPFFCRFMTKRNLPRLIDAARRLRHALVSDLEGEWSDDRREEFVKVAHTKPARYPFGVHVKPTGFPAEEAMEYIFIITPELSPKVHWAQYVKMRKSQVGTLHSNIPDTAADPAGHDGSVFDTPPRIARAMDLAIEHVESELSRELKAGEHSPAEIVEEFRKLLREIRNRDRWNPWKLRVSMRLNSAAAPAISAAEFERACILFQPKFSSIIQDEVSHEKR